MMTAAELAQAKREIELAKLSPQDRALMLKYPRHTLAAAKLIDSTPIQRCRLLPDQVAHDAGQDFQYLQWQESGQPYTRQ